VTFTFFKIDPDCSGRFANRSAATGQVIQLHPDKEGRVPQRACGLRSKVVKVITLMRVLDYKMILAEDASPLG